MRAIVKPAMNAATLALVGLVALSGCGQKESVEAAPAAVAKKDERPNIVFILADDMGYGDLSVNGQKNFTTPSIDKMAEEGIRFTNFYAGSAVCGPSRSVLMTGQNVAHTPVRANQMTIAQPDGSVKKISRTFKDEEVLVSEVLKEAGYHTGLVGKWGLGEIDDEGHPNDQGFDYFYGYLNHIHAHNHYPEYLWRNKEKVKLKNEVIEAECSYCAGFGHRGEITPLDKRVEYADDLIRDESVAFIERAAKQDQPFFLFVSLVSPHANNEAETVDWAHGLEIPSTAEFDSQDWPETAKSYAAMVRHVDNSVATIRAKLEELGLDKNTIVMFTADNGPHEEGGNDPYFHDSNGENRGLKRYLYEGGLRVPTVAWGPGIVAQGVVSEHIAYFGDFMATAAEAANATDKLPANLDSLSFLAELKGATNVQKKHDYLYWEFYEHVTQQAVRMGKWKAVRIPIITGPIALYDMENDRGETTDVAAAHPEVVAKIDKIMAESHIPSPYWTY